MEQIYPMQEDVVNQYCGLPVCVIMNDGSRHVGILSSCKSGKLLLNAEMGGGAEAMLNKVQPQVSKKKKGGKDKKGEKHKSGQAQAETQAYPYAPYYYGPQPYYPWGGALALDIALIAFLFLLL
ncbi:hypothetical protein L1N85_23235 [Paenibacillus alkaliterrae]|uniref:hypothetical protein n=1 Tax=Paenibacillus alkaliterrae TaxID=320909 RepID=UPI001F269379|nr:hypothetical protein [Paenibacillus alkaliterrae]MCF2941284.1 hypothetical protein [Paenibacillus alkaliterrae]